MIVFFFNDTATTEIYTLSLHDALPIYNNPHSLTSVGSAMRPSGRLVRSMLWTGVRCRGYTSRSEEHTSELQSRQYLVCRLLLEKKKKHSYSFQTVSQPILTSIIPTLHQ